MTTDAVLLTQLMVENRRLRETVRFLNTQAGTQQSGRPRPKHDGAQHAEVEEAYRLLVDSSLEGLLLIQDGRIVFANRVAADITGLAVRELLTTTLEQILAFVHPDDRAMVRQRHEDRLQALPSPSRYEFRAMRKDGGLRWVEIHAGIVEYRGRPATQIALADITAHKQVETELRQSWQVFQDMVENANDVLYSMDHEGVLTYISPASQPVLGYLPSEVLGQPVWTFIYPEDIPELQRSFQETLKGGLSPSEFRVRTKSGDIRWVRTSSRPIIEGNDVFGVRGVLIDISDRRRTEEALRQSERQLSSIFRAAPVGIGLAINRIIKDVNQSILDMTGYAREELIDRSGRVLYPDDEEFDRVGRDKYGQIRQRGSGAVETRWKRKDGTIIDVLLSSTPLNPDDWTVGVTFTALDITERKRAEQTLRDSEEMFSAVVGQAEDAIVLIQGQRLIFANQALVDMIGYNREELSARPFIDFAAPESRALVAERVESRLRGETPPSRYEARLLRRDGRIIHAELAATIVLLRGKPTDVGVIRDITERKRSATLLEVQRDLAVALSGIGDLPSGLYLCLQGAIRASELDCGGVYLRDEVSGSLDLSCHIGLSDDFVRQVSHYERETINTRLVMQGIPIYADYAQTGVPVTDVDGREGLRAIAVVPIIHGEQIIGCLNVASHTLTEVPRYARIALETIAGQISGTITRLKAEQALRESEERFRATFEQVAVGVAHVGLDGRWLRVNQRLCDIVGYTAEELRARTFQDITHPDDLNADLASACRVLAGDIKTYSMEKRYIRKQGSLVWINLTASLVRALSGKPQYFISVVEDITARKQAEESLRESEARYRSLFNTIADGVFAVGAEGQIEEVNNSACAQSGYAREDLIGMPVSVISGRSSFCFRDLWDKLRSHGSLFYETSHRRKDGTIVPVELSVTLAEQQGKSAILGVARDITERKRAEEALRLSEERFRTLFDAAPDAMYLIDLEGTLVDGNKAAEQLAGARKEELVGRNLFGTGLLLPRQIPEATAGLKANAMGKATGPEEFMVRRRDGTLRTIETRAYPIQVEGRPLVLGVARDITEQKRVQEQVRQREAELVHLTRVSTLGELASGIAHELNQPLSAIANYGDACLSLLQSGTPDVPRVTRNLQQIVSQSERAGGIIREMRSLIKKKRPQFAAVDLNAVMQSVLPLMRAEMADKSVELALELSEPLPRVCADTIQMEQVLLNLTRNAIDAMTGGEEYARRLTIRTKAVEGDMVQMEVCDTGVGLPAVDPGRIFEPFFTTKKEGLGLGLSISRSIVQMHQGVLTATRNPDRGSTFLVTLPAQPSGNR